MATTRNPTLLKIDSSPMGDRSVSRKLTAAFAKAWLKAHPGGTVISRDLTVLHIPIVDGSWVGAAYTPEDARTTQQKDALATSDMLIAELQQADEYVIGVPMHNFSIPSTLKLWIDQVVRLGKTVAYSAAGVEGLLKGKKVTLLMASAAVVPATVTFAANATSVIVPVTGVGIGLAVIHASALPSVGDTTASVTVASPGTIQVSSNASVGLGQSVAFSITLPAAAPTGGITVTLASSDPSKVSVTPASVTIAAGSTTPAA